MAQAEAYSKDCKHICTEITFVVVFVGDPSPAQDVAERWNRDQAVRLKAWKTRQGRGEDKPPPEVLRPGQIKGDKYNNWKTTGVPKWWFRVYPCEKDGMTPEDLPQSLPNWPVSMPASSPTSQECPPKSE